MNPFYFPNKIFLFIFLAILEASLELKLRIIWQMEQQRWEESEKRKGREKEYVVARKGRKVAKHYIFPVFCGLGGSKNRLAKAAGATPSDRMKFWRTNYKW